MKRATVAFLIAPAWIPAVTELTVTLRHADLPQEVRVAVPLVYAAIAYGMMLAVGLPLYRRFGGRGEFWRVAAIGAATGVVLVALYLLGVFTAAIATRRWEIIEDMGRALAIGLAIAVGLGVVVAATYWLIARPDRTASPVQHF